MARCKDIPQFLALDLCSLCGEYDTIQSYIPLGKDKDGVMLMFHVCEKCLATKSIEEMQKEMNEKRVG